LQRPSGSKRSQYNRDPLATGVTQQSAERIEERKISLAGTVLFDAAAAAHQQAGKLAGGT
jgi:hypothetical protein